MRLRRRPGTTEVVTLITRQGCHLCEEAIPVVQRSAAEVGARCEVVDVDSDPELQDRWTVKVPVVLLDGVEHAYWQVDEKALRAALRQRGR